MESVTTNASHSKGGFSLSNSMFYLKETLTINEDLFIDFGYGMTWDGNYSFHSICVCDPATPLPLVQTQTNVSGACAYGQMNGDGSGFAATGAATLSGWTNIENFYDTNWVLLSTATNNLQVHCDTEDLSWSPTKGTLDQYILFGLRGPPSESAWDTCVTSYSRSATNEDIVYDIDDNRTGHREVHLALTNEFTDAILFGIISGWLAPCPTNWSPGTQQARSWISDDHVSADGQLLKYRFKLPPQTEINTSYLLQWEIITTNVYNDGSGVSVLVQSNNWEIITGTGDTSNDLYSAEHVVQMPQFYCTATNGGTSIKYVANLTVSILPGGPPPGAGPGLASESSGSSCANCSGAASVPPGGGMLATFGLGDTLYGCSSGLLRIWAAKPSPSLATPGSLSFVGRPSDVVLIPSGGPLRQVCAAQALADIVTLDDYSYEIRYYYASHVPSIFNGLYQPSGAPFVTWKVQNPDTNTACNRLLLTETRGSTSWEYSYIYDSANNSWTTIAPGGLWKDQVISSNNVADGARVLTRITSQTNGTPAKIFSRTYKTFPWGEGVVSETEGSGSSSQTTTMTYYDAIPGNGTFTPLEYLLRPDGSWEYYAYTQLSDGRYVRSHTFRGHGDDPPSPGSTYTWYDYTPLGADDGTQLPATPRTVIEYLNGYMVSASYLLMLPGERRDIRAVRANAGWSDSDNLVTITKYYTSGPNLFRVQSVQRPDGVMSFHSYAQSTNGWQTNIVSSGQPNSGQTAIVNGTHSTTILDPLGRTVSVTVRDVSTDSILQQDVYSNFDDLDRACLITHLDGASNILNYACCGLESTVDRDGVTTVYLHDAAKREYGQTTFVNTSNTITRQNILDAAGRPVKTLRIGTDNSVITQSQSVYDTAGRLLAQTNALGGATTFAESTDPATGGLIRTTTYPDGGTRVDAYYLDGSLKSGTGSAVQPVRYTYGANYTMETKLDENGDPTSEVTTTYTDLLGRQDYTSYPNSGQSDWDYNESGQLKKQTDPDGVVTLFQYNARGDLEYTAVDMDRDGEIDWAGTDRITRTVSDVIANYGTTVRRVRTYVWPTDNVDAALLSTTVETSVDGLRSWQILWNNGAGLTNRSQTVYAGSGCRYTTNTAPDGSYTLTQARYGQVLAVSRYAPGGGQLGQTTYTFDAHGRQHTVTDARNGATTLDHNAADLVTSVTTPAPGPGYSPQTTTTYYNVMLQATNVVQPDGTSVFTTYHLTGLRKTTWGSRTYPVEYGYDFAGRMTTMKTWRNANDPNTIATTTWIYNGYGQLQSKRYADNTGPDYSYTTAGRLLSRTWARSISTYYGYNNAGELSDVSYSDGVTPEVHTDYNRQGRKVTVTSGATTTTSSYNDAGLLLAETYIGGPLNDLIVTNMFDQFLRRTNLSILNSQSSILSSVSFGWDSASRLSTVSDSTVSAGYSYVANSPLVEQILFSNATTRVMTTMKSWDHLNRLKSISSAYSASSAVSFSYAYNSANQRTKNTQVDGSYWLYEFDSLGQVTSGRKYFNDGTPVPGQQFGYTFDDVGNRTQTQSGGDQAGANLRTASYTANYLNQITQRDYPGTNDIIGVALVTNTVTVNGQTVWRKGEYFWSTVWTNNTSAPAWQSVTVASGSTTNAGHLFVPQTPEAFTHDADGNLNQDGRWNYTWDGENRLKSAESGAGVPPAAQHRLEFACDWQSRRIQKVVYTNDGSGYVGAYTNKFVYDGWNLIAILDSQSSILQSFTWGLDASGSQQGAGGVGGLLATTIHTGPHAGTYFPIYDGNHNIMAYIRASDAQIVASYDYTPFGVLIRATGPMAKEFNFLFSTKYYDWETGLYYYGFRHYDPTTGRWLSRDPIHERGGANLYGFVQNSPVGKNDALGLMALIPLRSQVAAITSLCERFMGCYRTMKKAYGRAQNTQGSLDLEYECLVDGNWTNVNTAMPGNGLGHCLVGYYANYYHASKECLIAANVGFESWEFVMLTEWGFWHSGKFVMHQPLDWREDTVRDVAYTLVGFSASSPEGCVPSNCRKKTVTNPPSALTKP